MPRAKNERLAAWPVLDAFDAWEPPPVQKMPPPIGGAPRSAAFVRHDVRFAMTSGSVLVQIDGARRVDATRSRARRAAGDARWKNPGLGMPGIASAPGCAGPMVMQRREPMRARWEWNRPAAETRRSGRVHRDAWIAMRRSRALEGHPRTNLHSQHSTAQRRRISRKRSDPKGRCGGKRQVHPVRSRASIG